MRPSSESGWSNLLASGKKLTKINELGPAGPQIRTIALGVSLQSGTVKADAGVTSARLGFLRTAAFETRLAKCPGPRTKGITSIKFPHFGQVSRSISSDERRRGACCASDMAHPLDQAGARILSIAILLR
jgi:hypothetical protein